jgi:hypothetical protein
MNQQKPKALFPRRSGLISFTRKVIDVPPEIKFKNRDETYVSGGRHG